MGIMRSLHSKIVEFLPTRRFVFPHGPISVLRIARETSNSLFTDSGSRVARRRIIFQDTTGSLASKLLLNKGKRIVQK